MGGAEKHGHKIKYDSESLELERKKRYGYVSKVEETGNYYKIRIFFPTIVPPGELREKLGIPEEMPDYAYNINLKGNLLTVSARLEDARVIKLTGLVNSFPDRFFREFVLDKPVDRYEAVYKDKALDITVFKTGK